MRLSIKLALSLALFTAPLAAQTTIHVPADQPTIQAAINAATSTGDTILVSPGVYTENLTIFSKSVTLKSTGGSSVTTINGNRSNAALRIYNTPDQSGVVDGFTFLNGQTTYSPLYGGVDIENAAVTF